MENLTRPKFQKPTTPWVYSTDLVTGQYLCYTLIKFLFHWCKAMAKLSIKLHDIFSITFKRLREFLWKTFQGKILILANIFKEVSFCRLISNMWCAIYVWHDVWNMQCERFSFSNCIVLSDNNWDNNIESNLRIHYHNSFMS